MSIASCNSTPQGPWGLKPRFDTISKLLTQSPRWVVWVAVPRSAHPGKVDKIPRQAANWQRGASTNTPAHWSTFERARDTYERNSSVLSGVGFVLTDNTDNIFAIDIDHCEPNDSRLVQLQKIGCYVERSPSGHGYRGIGIGKLSANYVNLDSGVEVYDGSTPRYVTITGHRLCP